ncbi:XRE family transcriptional regulator [Streptomyces sp. NK08204]|uniref:helix-turn-helix domain-containing protein n=1 Tax=Streptomyces sp. NK08204 TaxID=2873260 RepID=UPI001CED8F42|nr:XRE family transcriptional regulator [Streptomyces sp. NK08204]
MPRWTALPDDLDPQITEFIGQLRRLVDRDGLSTAVLADRTGYDKTSWERYLSGQLLAPKGAVVALAEITGAGTAHLSTMWELAERAWSRAGLRDDRTMEALRIVQADTAPGESQESGEPARSKGGPAVTAGFPAPAGVSPRASGASAVSEPYGDDTRAPRPGPAGEASGNRRRVTRFLAGLAGVLVVIAGVFLFTHQGGGKGDKGAERKPAAAPPPSPSATHPTLPPGVKCARSACTGKDAEAMGCSGELVTTAKTATVGTVTLEVRYSRTCGAAWGRITDAAPGDTVRLSVGKVRRSGDVAGAGDTIAYTPMVAVRDVSTAEACATLADGRTGCTR